MLPLEAEECLDELQRKVIWRELMETEWILTHDLEPVDLEKMLMLHQKLTSALTVEGLAGRNLRRAFCEEIARGHR